MWVLILHLFFPFKTKIMVFCFGQQLCIYLPELSQWRFKPLFSRKATTLLPYLPVQRLWPKEFNQVSVKYVEKIWKLLRGISQQADLLPDHRWAQQNWVSWTSPYPYLSFVVVRGFSKIWGEAEMKLHRKTADSSQEEFFWPFLVDRVKTNW